MPTIFIHRPQKHLTTFASSFLATDLLSTVQTSLHQPTMRFSVSSAVAILALSLASLPTAVHASGVSVAVWNSANCQGSYWYNTYALDSSLTFGSPTPIALPTALTPPASSATWVRDSPSPYQFVPYQNVDHAQFGSCTAQSTTSPWSLVLMQGTDSTQQTWRVSGRGGYCVNVVGGSIMLDCSGTDSYGPGTVDTSLLPTVQPPASTPSIAVFTPDSQCASTPTSFATGFATPLYSCNKLGMLNSMHAYLALTLSCDGSFSDSQWTLTVLAGNCQTVLHTYTGSGIQCTAVVGGSVLVDCTGRLQGYFANTDSILTHLQQLVYNPAPITPAPTTAAATQPPPTTGASTGGASVSSPAGVNTDASAANSGGNATRTQTTSGASPALSLTHLGAAAVLTAVAVAY